MNFLYLPLCFFPNEVEDIRLKINFCNGGLLYESLFLCTPEIFHDKWLQKEK